MLPPIVSKIGLAALFSGILLPSARAQFVINEFMANNLSSVDVDEDTQHEDWIEIQNTSNAAATFVWTYLCGQVAKRQGPAG